jgi:DNA-binding MarR family transcriptional regulator
MIVTLLVTNVIKKVTMKNSEKTLLYLLKHPKEEFHIRGLERKLGIAVQIISRSLKQLEKEGLVKIKTAGKQKFARFIFSEKSKSLSAYLLEKEKEEAKPELQPIISRLAELKVKIIVLFGSSLKSLAKANDIDAVFIDDRLNAKQIDKETTRLSAELPKPVVPLLLETKDVKKQYDKPAVQEALAGIVAKGFKEYVELMGTI